MCVKGSSNTNIQGDTVCVLAHMTINVHCLQLVELNSLGVYFNTFAQGLGSLPEEQMLVCT